MLLLLAAVDEGIGAAFVGSDADLLHTLLGIPEDHIPVGIALLGHEAPDARSFGDVSAKRGVGEPSTAWCTPNIGDRGPL